MCRPTIEELQTFWLLAYSRASLLDANAFLEAMETANPNSIEVRAMIDAAVVAYARPFNKFQVTRERRVAPLAEIPPPTHLAEFHQDALDLRNKLIGHKDATPARRHTTTPNVALVHIDSEGFNLHTTIISEMEAPMRNALKELCAYFVKHCEKNLRPLTRGYFSEVMKHPPGRYELVISKPPADWIRPFRPS
jgi:hypothetical protein